jgi:hypothetical protein
MMAVLRPWMYGDKELYWMSFALAGLPYGMNPWGWSAVGLVHQKKICGYWNSLVQWADMGDGEPTAMYLNGDGIESTIIWGDLGELAKYKISEPLPYYSLQQGFCVDADVGFRAIDSQVLDTVQKYTTIFQD